MNRLELGQQNIGTPVMQAYESLVDTIDQTGWPDFQREPVGYYFEKMIGHWLLQLMDKALFDEQLANVDTISVSTITLLLLRDMFRHNAPILRIDAANEQWVDPLFERVAVRLGLPVAAFLTHTSPFELEDMGNCRWATDLSKPFGIVPLKLFACHSAIVTGVQEEFDIPN